MNSQPGRRNYMLTRATLSVLDCARGTHTPLQMETRTSACYCFLYLKSGRAYIRIENQTHEILPGGIVFLSPEMLQKHIETSFVQPSEFLRWFFQYKVDNTFDVLRLFDFPVYTHIHESASFERAFFQHFVLFHSGANQKGSDIVLQQAKALEVMSYLLDCLHWSSLPTGDSSDIPPVFYEILQQIINAPEDGVQLKALAQQYHMHPTYISNRFKYHFGITPAQLCRQLVIEKARGMLLSENYTITEISSRLGFRDVSFFTQIFTEAEGVTPSKYRRSKLSEDPES